MTTSSNAIDRMTGLGDDIAKVLSSARKPPQAPPPNFPAGGEFSSEPTGYTRDVARLPQVESALSELPQLRAKAQEEFLRGTQAQTVAKAEAQKEAETMKRVGLEKIYEAPEVQQETIEFKPTRMEMEDYKALAGLLVGAAAIFGAGGKGSAMYALSALNGMMSGYNKGRADLFKQQALEFDKAIKSVQEKNKQALDALARMKENLVAKTDEFLAEKSQQIAIDSGGILAAQLRMNELDAAEKTLTNLQNGMEKRISSHEAAMARSAEREEARKDRIAFQNAMLSLRERNVAVQEKKEKSPEKNLKPPPKEIVAQNQLRNSLIPKLEEALPVLDRMNKEGKWSTMTTLLALGQYGTNAAEATFKDDPEALNLILTLAYFRSKEFETAGKALTRKEDQILAPIVRGDLRVYEGMRNAMSQGLKTLKQEQAGLEKTYPYLEAYNKAFRGDAAEPSAPSKQLSEQDQAALTWANANPSDPRSAAIKARLGVQ